MNKWTFLNYCPPELRDVYEEQRHKELPADQAQFHNVHDQEGDDKTSPRLSRSVKMPYLVRGRRRRRKSTFSILKRFNRFKFNNPIIATPFQNKYMEKVNQKAIRSPSLRLRFGRRSDPDLPPNFVSPIGMMAGWMADGFSRL